MQLMHSDGIFKIKAKAIIIASGCRERPRGFSNLPGSTCAGIYTVGSAQKFINIEGIFARKRNSYIRYRRYCINSGKIDLQLKVQMLKL